MATSELAAEFDALPTAYQRVLDLAQKRHNIQVTPLQELKGGRTDARLYLVGVSNPAPEAPDSIAHYVLKLDRINPKSSADEMIRHSRALDLAPPDFARDHLAELAFQRVEHDGIIAIFYAIAGQSLQRFRSLANYGRQSQLETIFRATNEILLTEWNRASTFEQAVHPQSLLARWLGFRLQAQGNIERFLAEGFHIHPATQGLLVQGQVFPNPLAYAREAERWAECRSIDAVLGFQHGDLNTTNILVQFCGKERELAKYYLIDLAMFREQAPLLYDQTYLEMSYLLRELSHAPLADWVSLVTRFAEEDIPNPDQAPVALVGACAVVGAGRRAFDSWVQTSHPSLHDDLWGQYRLGAVAAGLNFCNKAYLSTQERLAGLIFAAVHLKRYLVRFGAPMPVEVAHLYDASQPDGVLSAGSMPARTAPPPLPAQPTPLIGRQQEVAQVRELLAQENKRLLTLTGPGGTGKTRLGLQAATELLDQFQHGVFFVPLAEITAPGLVPSKIAQQLGVREGGSHPLLENLKSYLRDKDMLLLLDNFEHVVAAAPVVADLLAAAPQLKLLVTSRAPLNLRGEHEFPIPPLQLPDAGMSPSPERVGAYAAIKLFVERAQAVDAGFVLTERNVSAVAAICHRLDGLPLAIELAAARVKLLSPQAILARLGGAGQPSSLQLLMGGAQDLPARQQTLRNTLDWSYGLLDLSEQTLFARLGAFVGGFTLEAAERVCDLEGEALASPSGEGAEPSGLDVLEGVASLVNNSLLWREERNTGQTRFRMLETIREYALEQLEGREELDLLRQRHARYYAGLIVDEIGAKVFSPESSSWLDWVADEYDNVQTALASSQTNPEGLELGPWLTFFLGWFWYRRGYFGAGRSWSERVLASPAAKEDGLGRALALQTGALMAMWQGEVKTAVSRAEESLALWRQLGDKKGLAVALMNGGTVLINCGNDRAAHPLLTEAQALFQELGDQYFYAITLVHLGNVTLGLGDPVEARAWLDEAYALSREMGEDWAISFALNNLGELARLQGDYAHAGQCYAKSEALLRSMGDKGDLARLIHSQGYVAQHQGDNERAEAQFSKSLAMFRKLGNKRGIAECLAGLGGLEANRGQPWRGAMLLSAAQALLDASGAAWWPADRAEVERNRATIMAALGNESFGAAWEAGATMTLEQAIVYASGDL